MRYTIPKYSDEQYEIWNTQIENRRKFLNKHIKETEKRYIVNGCTIVCRSIINTEYIKKKEHRTDSYIITVYDRIIGEEVSFDDMEHILAHRVCKTKDEANNQFLILKSAC